MNNNLTDEEKKFAATLFKVLTETKDSIGIACTSSYRAHTPGTYTKSRLKVAQALDVVINHLVEFIEDDEV